MDKVKDCITKFSQQVVINDDRVPVDAVLGQIVRTLANTIAPLVTTSKVVPDEIFGAKTIFRTRVYIVSEEKIKQLQQRERELENWENSMRSQHDIDKLIAKWDRGDI